MIKMNRNLILVIILMAFSTASYAKDWSYEFEPYALISSIDGDASVGRVTGADVAVDFNDILETLEFAFMGHFEAHHKSGWGTSIDYGFMNLGEDISGPLGGVTKADVHQGVLEVMGLYRVGLGNGELDYMAGIRWWDNDLDVTVDPAILPGTLSRNVEEDWVDLVVGARWRTPINDKWKFQLAGDIGGFGLESDFTGKADVGFLYKINKRMDLDLRYKATWVDYEDGTPGTPGYFKYDTVTHGPLIGLNFKF